MDLRASDTDPGASGAEDEDETPAQKRLRLAKLYLESVKDDLAEGDFDAADIDKEIISARLKQDVMEHAGKVHLFIADSLELGEPSSRPFVRLRGHRFSVTSAVASEACTYLFTAGKEGSIIKWDIRTGKKLAIYHKQRPSVKGKERAWNEDVKGHMDEVLSLALSSDGVYLASAGKDRRVGVWDVAKSEWVTSFGGHKDTISAVAFRKGSRQLYTASHDRTVKLFDLSPGVMGYVETLFGHQDPILGLDALRAETCVTVGGRDRTARFWKIVDESQLVFRGGGRSKLRELLEGGALEGMDQDETSDNGRRKNDNKVTETRYVEGSLDCIAMIDETTFLTGGDSGSICLWAIQKKKPIFTQPLAHGLHEMQSETEGLIRSPRYITALACLRYSDLFASGSWEGSIRLWKLDRSSKFRSFSLVAQVPAPGFVNSIQLLSIPKGALDEASWTRKAELDKNEASTPVALLVAGMGQEPRLGRWMQLKGEGITNSTIVMVLHSRSHVA
ncbi:WD40 repeat-like protein [Punctularia strigosozonata HHB-11173 SS5]|uniref:WD40 repeat-like protein n=1 Tax=Punctularia strigosozonata (strain HHB-11173) TaxID=741275 RepID=UPI0004416B38|nr:WD40 repeat-like protein [Punctularia strigosozonata HHB-11173 SS5]EIN14441.1 WD40 repeat-like protein [Punctularia strigosozonata HHB-11173 SS5]